MGQIIGEGITFDDVLLVPAYSEVIPNQVSLAVLFDKDNQVEHSNDECRYGYGYGTSHGNRDGETRRYWHHP